MKLSTLNQCHPSYRKGELERFEGLYCGGEEWREKVSWWIPKNTAEPDALWEERKRRAVYHNHAGPIVDLIAAWLFSEPVTVEGLDQAWLNNVDRRGSDWTPFWKGLFTEALIYKQSFCWVNLPARSPDIQLQTLAEEESMGLLNAYLVPLEAEEVIDWGEDDVGALSWVLIRQDFAERGGVEMGRRRGIRWFYVDASQIRIWEWEASREKPNPDADDTIAEKASIQHGIGRLPVVRLELPDGLFAMGKLHDPAVALLRASNDLDWSLHRANHSLMTVTTREEFVTPKLGAGYYISLRRDAEGKDEVGYAEPSGATFTASSNRIKDLREDLYRVVHALASAASPSAAQQQSGDAKARDWQAMEVILSAYAGLVLECMRQVGGIVAGIRKASSPVVTGLDGWQQEDLSAMLEQIASAVGLSIPSPTLKKELHKRIARRLLPDAEAGVRNKISQEIDTAPEDPVPFLPPK